VCYIESHSRDKPAYSRDAIFRIFSMTKPVTAVCILQLVAQGRVALSDPVHKYIPGFKDFRVLSAPSPDAAPPPPLAPGVDLKDVPLDTEPLNCDITLLHLLTHTSGLNYGIFSDTVVDRYLKNAFGYPALKTWLMRESLETIVDKICTSGSYVDGGNGPVGRGGLLEFQPGTPLSSLHTRFVYLSTPLN
jgi:CubicO group peptidase (beta-lactamase class C family)